MAEAIVDLQSVTFSYDGQAPALEDVSLKIAPGEFASIVGPNGGGKTTLVRLMLGLLHPQKGTVKLFGQQPEKTRLFVGYTPQQLRVDRLFPITVGDVVLTGRLGGTRDQGGSFLGRVFRRYTRQDRAEAAAAMEQMGVAELASRTFGALSGGQRQRVLIARALCGRPKLLILDEPTNNVDPSSVEQFYHLLEELNRTVAILIVSHDLGVVSRYVRSVVCVNQRVVVHPTSEFDGRAIREIYGGDLKMIRHDHRCSEGGHLFEGEHLI